MTQQDEQREQALRVVAQQMLSQLATAAHGTELVMWEDFPELSEEDFDAALNLAVDVDPPEARALMEARDYLSA